MKPVTVVCKQRRSMVALLVLVVPACAQPLSFGLKAGVPITDYFDTGSIGSVHGGGQYFSAPRRYTLGASVEWQLNRSIGFEADVLYHRFGYSGTLDFVGFGGPFAESSTIDVKGNSWDFPIMAKYRFLRVVRPYIAGGGVLRYIGPANERGEETISSLTITTTPINTSDPSDLRKRFYQGLTVGGGVELPIGRFRLLPEIRYIHWTSNISGPGGLLRFSPNQVEFLLGVSFLGKH